MAKSRNKRIKKGGKAGAKNMVGSYPRFQTSDENYVTISEKGIEQYKEIITRDKSTWTNDEKVLVALYETMKSENTHTLRYV